MSGFVMTYALHHVAIVVNPGGEFGIREMEIRRFDQRYRISHNMYYIHYNRPSVYCTYICTRFWNWRGKHNALKSPRPNCTSALNDTSCAIIHDFRYWGRDADGSLLDVINPLRRTSGNEAALLHVTCLQL